ncbi:S8 family serine peptidase [Flavobacterium terrigena]|uniref:Por secretion system C-terminal sorting domain-containing protein n=1 Tax=Flavobacterium terrigena TaxID=402734 RepID=A0A1H6UK95_9FLAO|nr:S8 family serine peptidase [Flavobacterium terrigena]SEI92669.1 Por secretion system C-terminal sorting domain-containing protein [Flavobacterium terrigena]
MKKLYFLLILVVANFGYAQIEDAWVYFNDKPSSATFLANPLTMLTQRSLDRRTAQNISLDITDVPVEQTYITQITAATGITVMAKSKWLNALHIRGTQADIQALTALSFVNNVKFANHSLNPGGRISQNANKIQAVNKNLDAQVTYNYGGSQNQIEMLNGHLLHQQNFTGQGKIIAVLDAGFPGVNTAAPFQNLITNNKILGGYNFPDANTNYFSRNNHGTNVLSTMGGFVEGQLVGTAPNSQYYLFITEDVNSENPVEESYWVEAAELADYYGVDVINSSLGYLNYDNTNYSYQYDDMIGNKTFASRGVNMAFSKGIVVVISAGNSGATVEPHIATPGDAIGALTIGAVNSTEVYASFSSIGPSFDGRVKPDVCAKGAGTTVSSPTGTIYTSNGTSFSSPVIAGMIATFWSAVPTLTAQQVVNFVKQSADNYNAPTNQKGYGIPDFQLALNNALGLEPIEPNQSFLVYPNPAENQITFQLEKKQKGIVYLYDVLGQNILIKEISENNNVIDIQNLSNGVYYYNFESDKAFKGKIIKK